MYQYISVAVRCSAVIKPSKHADSHSGNLAVPILLEGSRFQCNREPIILTGFQFGLRNCLFLVQAVVVLSCKLMKRCKQRTEDWMLRLSDIKE
jgi:hypothetical protein